MSRGNIWIKKTQTDIQTAAQAYDHPMQHKKAANYLALGLRITLNCLSLPDAGATTQLIFGLWSSDLLREERARLLEKLQSMNGRLFPAVRVNFILATVVRHGSDSPQLLLWAALPPGSNTEAQRAQWPKDAKQLFQEETNSGSVSILLSLLSITHFTSFKCAQGPSRERAHARSNAARNFFSPNVSETVSARAPRTSTRTRAHAKLCGTHQKQHPGSQTWALTCPRTLSWTHTWLTAKIGRKLEFGPYPFSFPPSHLFNFLTPLLSSSSGESLTARLVENQYSLYVCVCVYVRESERERERGNACVCVCGTSERRPVLVRRSSPIESSSNPARLPRRLRPERCATIGWFSHQSTMIRLGHVFLISPALLLPLLSLSLSFLIYLFPVPISFPVNTWLCKMEIRKR